MGQFCVNLPKVFDNENALVLVNTGKFANGSKKKTTTMGAMDLDALTPDVDIKKYIFDKYTPPKQPEQTLEVTFKNDADLEKRIVGDDNLHAQLKCSNLTFPFARNKPVAVGIKAANLLVEANVQLNVKRVVELTLGVQNDDVLYYQPGDTIAILPRNPSEIVSVLLNRLDLHAQADSTCYLKIQDTCKKKTAKVPLHIPPETTPREMFTDCLNLNAAPKKQFLAALATCTSDSFERSFLESLASKEATAHYNELILERGFGLLELLACCPTCKPTIALLAEHLPRLLPRPYSIANSTITKPNELRIIYSILHDKPGITTAMLDRYAKQLMKDVAAEARIQPTVFMYAREPNQFRYTEDDKDKNQILIAVGTAIAPFIGFMEHKAATLGKGKTFLYAGAKTLEALPKHNYLRDLENKNILNRFLACASTGVTDNYRYVQELLSDDGLIFVDFLLDADTTLYVCADGAKISKSIEEGIANCLQQVLSIDAAEATQMLKDMRAKGKYREDLWL